MTCMMFAFIRRLSVARFYERCCASCPKFEMVKKEFLGNSLPFFEESESNGKLWERQRGNLSHWNNYTDTWSGLLVTMSLCTWSNIDVPKIRTQSKHTRYEKWPPQTMTESHPQEILGAIRCALLTRFIKKLIWSKSSILLSLSHC